MKEILTKKFWRDVKKTFDEARGDPPQEISDVPANPTEEADNSSSANAPKPPEPSTG